MGVEHYVVCNQCKEYIDIQKSYAFYLHSVADRPPIDDPDGSMKMGGYWSGRGVWFMYQHRGHQGVEFDSDSNDNWFNKEPYLKEVFPHDEDLKLRVTWIM